MTSCVDSVAMDGPAGAGKSAVARKVAGVMGFLYVDTGAMYRAVALKAIRLEADPDDPGAMTKIAAEADISFDAAGVAVRLDGEDVSREIRGSEVAAKVKYAARVPGVRRILADMQRNMAASRQVVMEGRDITTLVLPDARWKFFFTASPEARAKRRLAEVIAAGREASLEEILADITRRDESDYQVGPMREARDRALRGEGILYVDTTDMTRERAAEAILAAIRAG